MPLYHCVAEMVQFRKRWQYHFYRTSGTAAEALASMKDLGFLGALGRIHVLSARPSVLTVSRVPIGIETVVPREGDSDDNVGIGSQSGLLPDITQVTALVSLRSASGAKRNLSLRGLPDARTLRDQDSGASTPASQLVNGINDLINYLAQSGFQIRSLQGPETEATKWHFVQTLAAEANSGGVSTTITTRTDHGFVVGNRIKFDRQRDFVLFPYNGEHIVLAVPSPKEFVVAVRYRGAALTMSPGKMRVRRAIYNATNIVGTSGGSRFVRFTSRDTGGFDKRGGGKRLSFRQ